jgi:biopolymer transport protein TolQ
MLDVLNISFQSVVKAAPLDSVTSLSLEGSAAAATMDLSFFSLFMQADVVVKAVMIMLILASIWSWAIIFDKWILFKSVKGKTNNFEKSFWSGQSLENLFERVKGRENHPMALVFASAMQEWQTRNVKDMSGNHNLRASTKERIYQAMQVASSKSIDKLEKNLTFLATVGSSAPFIGLFGTVWGIMVSFQSIAISKNTTLAVVAPGIAEALLATAFGLAAAIPAVIFYNKFAGELNRVSSNLEDFSNELGAIISRELDNIK